MVYPVCYSNVLNIGFEYLIARRVFKNGTFQLLRYWFFIMQIAVAEMKIEAILSLWTYS